MIVQEVQEVELGEVEEEGQALLGNLSGLEILSFVRFSVTPGDGRREVVRGQSVREAGSA